MVVVNLFMGGLIARSVPAACAVPAVAFLIVALLIGACGPLTNARQLEEIAA